jgi:ABC-2 type transport system ATP-binding protein
MPIMVAPVPQRDLAPHGAVVARWDHVTKRYRDIVALDDFSLTAHEGQVLALLGPNGAGKTTAIGVLLGLRAPDSGTARIFGGDPRELESRRYLGVTPQELSFPGTLKVREIIDFARVHYPHPRTAEELFASFGLADLANRQVGGLSIGQRRRLAIAMAFAGNPRAVVLDEPTTGLDVETRRAVWQTLRAYVAGGGSVLLTTHYLEEAEALAQRVVVINRGRLVADGSVETIRAHIKRRRVRFRCAAPPSLPPERRLDTDGDRYTLLTEDADAFVRELVGRAVPFSELEVAPASFEDAFLELMEEKG